ncbi:tRNA:Cm32/Um32 methyltransferase [Prochlorococcus marinus str. MIT 9107]|uniref:tRNA (cytidine/uridine-2'-O-)-methyltransferase TrmJ n=1 Tax=Prochlorococcus marinus str. MIT 9116 TaxID=167544 RepID=A0A0A1ZR77_PROMR|nr:RNA methyltransferase [Prochlorococcus marinus]KGF90644.1 tRNA:Cm32/Um32 methyltransferase [Prochlorococcus marinus str. MIT 9107]KGF90769.1 tRNA:Cm32/Um32 methyltransferase [Prochlorococcus marinus str. MIT 9116]KGF93669.1 tRNA:Cm32/Um32 methyltransferase [Prochlorococcus marinus str. MIT 9123]
MDKNFSNLKVILVEPNGPLNVGCVARLCSNFEVHELRIVSPKCDIFSIEAKKMALKGQKFLDHCKVFDNLEKAIFDCDLVIASSGRIDVRKDLIFESSEDIFNWTTSFKKIKNLAIIFGREDRGLTNSELLLANKIFTIPSSQNNPSLNLSHAVSIVLYELNKSSKRNLNKELEVFNLASSKQIHDSFGEIEEMLLRVGYLLKHTSRAKINKFKNYILRANTSMHEINVLRGIVNQINWFLNNSKKN